MSFIDKIANLLVLILLIEMMITVGLGVPLRNLTVVFADAGLVVRAGLANYFVVPAIAITLLYPFLVLTTIVAFLWGRRDAKAPRV